MHYFSEKTALEMLKEVGYEIVDWFYTFRSIGLANCVV